MLGTALRGVHRYAADAFVSVMAAHIVREWVLGHYRHFPHRALITGCPWWHWPLSAPWGLLAQLGPLGTVLVVSTAEWTTPALLASPWRATFWGRSLGDRLFTLFVFIHIGIPLLMIFGLWFHIQRISLARVFPPRALAWGPLSPCWRCPSWRRWSARGLQT